MTLDLAAADRAITRGRLLTLLALAGVVGVYILALQHTPPERVQGLAQKIFYLHVPAAWSGLMAFVLVGITSALFLWLKEPRLDAFAEASAEVGLMFSVIMLTTGPIWGKPIWGTWWTWDARLTFTLFEFLLFCGYFALRSSVREREERAKFSAVVGIMGMILVPFIHLTVYLFNTTHPDPVVARVDGPALPWVMLRTFLVSLGVFTLLYIGFVMQRYGIAIRTAHREALDA